MKTNNIKQFSLENNFIIIGEVIKEENDYLIINNLKEIVVQYNEEEHYFFYFFKEYYSDFLFPATTEQKLYYNSIVIETDPETNVLVNYIAFIKEIEKEKQRKEKPGYTLNSQRVH